jgi:DNA helicase II / ATP-dependent DNA helicase PcrA
VDAWVEIRRKARGCHAQALKDAQGDRRATSIVAAALKKDDLEVRRLAFNPGLLGSLDRSSRLVNVAKGQDPVDELVVIAHEIGHFHLHHDPYNEVTVRPDGLGGDPVDSGAGKVEGYSPRERKEVQADVFAGEFLCPSDWLRDQYVTHGKRPGDIARELGLSAQLVMHQMIRALLLPPLRPTQAAPAGADHGLDESQKKAVRWDAGPLLVDAGPGTGKTRTLVKRVEHLLAKGSPSSSILALTFSNKAAEEMRERLSAMNSAAAIEMWIGTFHAFGLELVTKWPTSVRRTEKVRVLDQTGSLALLEKNLDKLPLNYYQNLYEPAYDLVPVLRVISRCKDELITPDEYRKAADAAFTSANTDQERETAERAQEIAGIYQVYQQALADEDAVDFGDLIMLSIQLLQTNPEVRKHVANFKHVLVDEFQDVNAASDALLRAICRENRDVWVVADQRQSIYRFRGAEPANVPNFAKSFGGSRHALANNYRSFAPIVRVFERFSRSMASGALAGSWSARRSTGGSVALTVAPTVTAEAEAIRDNIEDLRKKGVPYGQQVILARSHLTLARITSVLEKLGVPLLYHGDLFERPEIRDLLSLVALDAEYGGIGLIRVGALPEYGVPRQDCLEVIRWGRENKLPVIESLTRLAEIERVSESGQVGLARLGCQLQGLSKVSPWTMLTTWLFERSSYLSAMLTSDYPAAQQQRVAIYQLLKVCNEDIVLGDLSRRRFLERIRRIEALNEETAYRAISSEATDMDAVSVMTIHGSKGLEFSAVHLPALATGYMPANWRGVRIEPPAALHHLAMQPTGHEAEEECLFFVALSRARDFLSISRAEKYTARKSSASKFLNALNGTLPVRRYPGSGKSYGESSALLPPAIRDGHPERELNVYDQCPARYRYEILEGLRGGQALSAYVRFHRCVYKTLGWLEAERQKGSPADTVAALAQLATVWAAEGPVKHSFESYYRTAAEGMVRGMVSAINAESGQYDRQEWAVPLGDRTVLLTPDRVLLDAHGTVRVQRIRTGRKTKSEPDKPIYALLRRGAALKYPGRRTIVEILYLGSGERVPVAEKNDAKLLSIYSDAIGGIERGDFHPQPDPRQCPSCPCYFMCGG